MSTLTERRGGSILTFTGTKFWPLDPRADEVHLIDIAHALSNLCRFTGHTRSFYSVGEHSCRVHDAIKDENWPQDVCRWALLHDAAEAYLGDIARPTKHAADGFGEAYREAEDRLIGVIAAHFGLLPDEPPIVKVFDNRVCATEQRDLFFAMTDHELMEPAVPLPNLIDPWSPILAKQMFLDRARELGLEEEA